MPDWIAAYLAAGEFLFLVASFMGGWEISDHIGHAPMWIIRLAAVLTALGVILFWPMFAAAVAASTALRRR
jgi:hypothetical protein